MARTKTKRSTDRRQNKEIKKLKKDVKMLKAPIERKFLDVAMEGAIASSSETIVLNNVGRVDQDGTVPNQNASMSRRVGKSIHMSRIRIKGFVSIVAPSLASGNPGYEDFIGRVRMLLVRWHQNDASAISTPDDFLTAAAYGQSYSGEDAFIDGFKKKYPEKNYEVLYDKVVNLQAPEQATQGPAQTNLGGMTSVFPPRARVNIDLKLNHDVNWAQVPETASPSQNSLALYLIGGNGAPVVGTQRYFKLLNSRLDFIDA